MDNRLETLFIGRHATFVETLDSTNSFMNILLSQQQLPEGAVIVAREQTAGRGQANERWISEAGKNLLMSVVFYPSFISPQHLFQLSKTFSLGISDGVKKILGSEVKIKWPNDIYFDDKKLCGMLIENSIRNPSINHTVLGVGLNINQEIFPSELQNPTSLNLILEKELTVNDCLNILCNALEARYLQLKSGNHDAINEDYTNSLYRFCEMHYFENRSERFKAKITGIADDGKIFLKRENGVIERYDFKEVKYVI